MRPDLPIVLSSGWAEISHCSSVLIINDDMIDRMKGQSNGIIIIDYGKWSIDKALLG